MKKRRKREVTASGLHTLAYSYDVISILLTLKMARMIYDDYAEAHLQRTKEAAEAVGLETTFEKLPQLSLRYVGYDPANRQTISIPRVKERQAGQRFVEAGDPTAEESDISIDHVSRLLGRHATRHDLEQHIAQKQGSRSMSGVRGELFAYSTWLVHATTSLEQRGLSVGGVTGLQYITLENKGTMLSARVIECASKRNMAHYGAFALQPALPGTYSHLDTLGDDDDDDHRADKRRKTSLFAPMQRLDPIGYRLPGI